jgi:hypothetical protein
MGSVRLRSIFEAGNQLLDPRLDSSIRRDGFRRRLLLKILIST